MAAEAVAAPETVVSEVKRRLKLMPNAYELYSDKWCMVFPARPLVECAKPPKITESHLEPTLQKVLKWCEGRMSAGITLRMDCDENGSMFMFRRAYPEEMPDYEAKRKKELTDTVTGALAEALKNLAVSGKAPAPEAAAK